MLDSPINDGIAWIATRARSMALLQTAHRIRNGKLHLPMSRKAYFHPHLSSTRRLRRLVQQTPSEKKTGRFVMIEGCEPKQRWL